VAFPAGVKCNAELNTDESARRGWLARCAAPDRGMNKVRVNSYHKRPGYINRKDHAVSRFSWPYLSTKAFLICWARLTSSLCR
jgi:hypothetical protein